MKTCNKCGAQKPRSEFYAHPGMTDGLLGHCKECHKRGVRANRAAKIETYQAYDRTRGGLPDRVALRESYARTDGGRAARRRASRSYIARNPDRRKATTAVRIALRDGKLFASPCWVCGCSDVEGHHPDYSRPLDVVWLCKPHHQQLHNEHNEYERNGSS